MFIVNSFFKRALAITGLMLALQLCTVAQTYQAKIDTMWAGYRYEQIGDKYIRAYNSKASLSTWTSTDTKMVYYWRMAPGHTRADMIYRPAYMRKPVFHFKLQRVSTEEVLVDTTITTTAYLSEDTKIEVLSDFVVPADEYYRVEVTVDNSSYVKLVKYYLFQRESTYPVEMPNSLGGYGSHLFDWGTTDPTAPTGNAYDWAYLECMVPYQYQHPCDYFMTIGALNSYMGIQTNGRKGDDDFDRRVLFSVWDNGNTDENPDLPDYMRAQVFDYNHLAVSGHGGGEGSSGTAMFKDGLNWWRPDHWVQFLLNVRPENVQYTIPTANGSDSILKTENTIMTAWYKMDTDSEWKYIASIRAAFINELISGWYSFIENFGGSEGWGKHRVNYRHAFMRSAQSGKWYNRNYVQYFPSNNERGGVDVGHGASADIENAFYLEYGGYAHLGDSSHYTNLITDCVPVDTINLDRMNDRIDQALKLSNRYVANQSINAQTETYPSSIWTIVSATGSNPARMLDDDLKSTYWTSPSSEAPHQVVLKADQERTITAFTIGYQDGYGNRCRLVDIYWSKDGEEWTLGADSIYIYNETNSEVTLPTPLTAQYYKLQIYDPIDNGSLRILNLSFKGAYNLDALKARAAQILEEENTLNGYGSKDLAALKSIYADGACTDADALAAALKDLALNGDILKYGRVASKAHINSSNLYLLRAQNGSGYLAVTPEGKLTLRGATMSEALDEFKTKADITDPYNNWHVIVSEEFPDLCYIYNAGAKKYINFGVGGYLSDEPYALSPYFTARVLYIAQSDRTSPDYNQFLLLNPTRNYQVVYKGNRANTGAFEMLANHYLRPSMQEAKALIDTTYKTNRLNLYKEKAEALLSVPEGVVGSIAQAQVRQQIEALYNEGHVADIEALAQAIDNATLLQIESGHIYRITNLQEGLTASALTASATTLNMESASPKSASQIWMAEQDRSGFKLTSQNVGLAMQPMSESQRIQTVPRQNAFTYHFAQAYPGAYYLQQSEYQPYTLSGSQATVQTAKLQSDGTLWQIQEVNGYNVTLNAAGNQILYVDFDLQIPQDVEAYVAESVTPDGVIKLRPLQDIIPANTPVVLKGASSATITFQVLGHDAPAYDGNSVIIGNLFKKTNLTKKTYYTLRTSGSNSQMKLGIVASNIPENQGYILVSESLPNLDTYTFDFDDLIDAIESTAADTPAQTTDTYDLQGRKVSAPQKGQILIRDHKAIKVN